MIIDPNLLRVQTSGNAWVRAYRPPNADYIEALFLRSPAESDASVTAQISDEDIGSMNDAELRKALDHLVSCAVEQLNREEAKHDQ